MTLAIAVFESPTRFGIVADTLLTRSHGGISDYASKISTRQTSEGDLFIAAAGGCPATDRLLRHLHAAQANPLTIEQCLLDAFDAVVGLCGSDSPNDYPKTGGYLLVASRCGIVEMDAWGTLVRSPRWRAVGEPMYAAAYMEAWAHAGRPVTMEAARACVESARHWIPTVGGDVETAARFE